MIGENNQVIGGYDEPEKKSTDLSKAWPEYFSDKQDPFTFEGEVSKRLVNLKDGGAYLENKGKMLACFWTGNLEAGKKYKITIEEITF